MENNSKDSVPDLEQSKLGSISSLTQVNATQSNAIQVPSISLPKGGGALKGIDEKFEVNSANGTASFSIPLPITAGRNGFGPSLALSYNSGGGNSHFGLGWSIGLPSIQRKTDKQIPKYSDEDVFMFSGAEDLVPFLEKKNTNWIKKKELYANYSVYKYRPRIEGGFARIERIDHHQKGTYWRVTTRDNITTIFGRSNTTRISNPNNNTQIYQWLPELSYDDKGNCMLYEYKSENLEHVPNKAHERNRLEGIATIANQYIKRIKYGNHKPYYAIRDGEQDDPYDPRIPQNDFLFELVFDYGEHTNKKQPYQEELEWEYRADPFSSYRSGFEIRTNRLCKRILMFHHFEEEQQFIDTPDQEKFGTNYLVKSLELNHRDSSINGSNQAEVTYLNAITQKGHIRKGNHYYEKSLPPIEFQYQELQWNTKIKAVDSEHIQNVPVGLTNTYQWVDLYGEGISGILTEQSAGWYYKQNNGDVKENGQVNFNSVKVVAPRPSVSGLSNGSLSIQDLEGNGKKQIVVNNGALHGFFELTDTEDWTSFQAFQQKANIDLQDPNVRLLDLTGDGKPDIVVTEENVFTWYANAGKTGNQNASRTTKPYDDNTGPAIVFANQEQSIFLADFSGDGLTDIVRIRNGEICYWANMGYGQFSAKISMSNAPYFDHPELFNPQYLHLADISGTGATDILYLGQNTCKAFINHSGNAWSNAHEIAPFYKIDTNSRLSVIDLLGSGTSCIVWSSDLPDHAHTPMRYMDLMSSKKPHVLVQYRNNMGKVTSYNYKSSTHYYIKDKLQGTPWKTKLPFPVQVVSEVVIEEHITNVRFATQYSYHNGYYDHAEREFRGFGRVEQLDTEEYEVWNKKNTGNQLEKSEVLYQAPILTKTWYHTGAFMSDKSMLDQFEDEYWYNHSNFKDKKNQIADFIRSLPEGEIIGEGMLSVQELREAYRACKGMVIRQEVFSFEGDPSLHNIPYTVATHNCNVQRLQPKEDNLHAVFITTESEAITFHYERAIHDPRIAHNLNIKIDALGNVLESVAIVYPRMNTEAITKLIEEANTLAYERNNEKEVYVNSLKDLQQKQAETQIIYTVNSFTNDIDTAQDYRLRLPASAKTYEITGINVPVGQNLYRIDAFVEVLSTPQFQKAYHTPAANAEKGVRLIEHIISTYYDDQLETALLENQMAAHGIPYQSYQLAFDEELLGSIYGTKMDNSASILKEDGGYVQLLEHPDQWWIPSGYAIFKETQESFNKVKEQFFSPIAYLDPFKAKTKLEYYKEYYLFPQTTVDALENRVEVLEFNFRTMSSTQIKDPNDNISKTLLDELGLVKTIAFFGKGNEADNLLGHTEYTTETERDQIKNYFSLSDTQALRKEAADLLKNATTRFVYDFDRYRHSYALVQEQTTENALPCGISKYIPSTTGSIVRERHYQDVLNDPTTDQTSLQLSFEYTDGLGNVAMQKTQAEPGEALQLDIKPNCEYTLETMDTGSALRWIGNGRTVLNNKGNPVKQYEPYFSVTPFYEDHKELTERGVTPIIYYDALSRNIKTEFPDGTKTEVRFNAWQQSSYDQNDCHTTNLAYHTPTQLHLDTLGRPMVSIAHNRMYTRDALGKRIPTDFKDEYYSTQINLDIEGNTESIIDARGNQVMLYRYTMLGHRIYEKSMDAGERWSINNIAENPIRQWDSKAQRFEIKYDELQRPIAQWLYKKPSTQPFLIEQFTYGEEATNAKENNVRGQLYAHYDSSGLVSNKAFDFKGNLLESTRQLPVFKKEEIIDWSQAITLEDEIFTLKTKYDALNRMCQLFNWHRTPNHVAVYVPSYNERGVLQSEIQITGAQTNGDGYEGGKAVPSIKEVLYNEKGQRTLLKLGNDTTTRYLYNPKNYRLQNLKTTRKNIANAKLATGLKTYPVLQDLHYSYDAIGNIIRIKDQAQERVIHGGVLVEPICNYEYDALDRLIKATGRENKTYNTTPNCKEPAPADVFNASGNAIFRMYRQTYYYDAVGNIEEMYHIGDHTHRWKRLNTYEDDNNRLKTATTDRNTITYRYNEHGSILNFCEGFTTHWDYLERLHQLELGGGGVAYYQYDNQLERSRKVIEKTGGIKEERLYLGGMEIYRRWEHNTLVEEIETHHLMLEDQRVLLIEDIQSTDNQQLTTGTKCRYQYSNHLGSVGLELDEKAKIISYEEYHPYGTVAYQAKNQAIKATAKRYRYTGMERDSESGLNYHSARYYLPWLGRWLSADPIGVEGGINIYIYAFNRPIIFTDINGLNPNASISKSNISNEESHLLTDYVGSFFPDYIKFVEKGGMSIGIAPFIIGGSAGGNVGLGERMIINPLSEKVGEITLTKEVSEHAEVQLEIEVDPGVELAYNFGGEFHIGYSILQRGLGEGHVSDIGNEKIDGNTYGGVIGVNFSAIVGIGLSASMSTSEDGLIDIGIGGEFTISDTIGASLLVGGESSQSEIKSKENILSKDERKKHKRKLKKIREKTKKVLDSSKEVIKKVSEKVKQTNNLINKGIKKVNNTIVKKTNELLQSASKKIDSFKKSIFSLF